MCGPLPVGTEDGVLALDAVCCFLRKSHHRVTRQSHSWVNSQERGKRVSTQTVAHIHSSTTTAAKTPVKGRMDAICGTTIHRMKEDPAIKKEQVLVRGTAWMSLANRTLSERSLTQKATYYRIPLIWKAQNKQIHRDRKGMSGH